MTIQELREKRNTAWNACKAFLDSHRTERGTLTAEDDATYTRMEQEITDLGKEIARLERQEKLEAELNAPVNTPLTARPAAQVSEKTGRASTPTARISTGIFAARFPCTMCFPRARTRTAATLCRWNSSGRSPAALMRRT